MSFDIALSKSRDLDLSDGGDLSLVDGAERIAQQIEVTLRAFLGEWFLDVSFGVPYLNKVLVKGPDRAQLEAIFRARIGDVPGVTSVQRIDLLIDHAGRALAIEFEADTTEGLVARRFYL
ncbi:hypothetical protein ASL20_09635 [Cupriavidus necator]|uniref:hypothetical protein n=1 Tax=Cupriavidus necator TaxID=106590 RepID=UPI00073562C6|nr:hypothetical protein [Cupriavidus necator]KUE88877.1 hypothetical protein ASL20_09635 [Cupriavidus necator]